jgi:hypothetical protein
MRYILRYVVNEEKSHNSVVYTQNLRSDTLDGYVKEFVQNEAFRRNVRKDNIHMYHEVVSLSADENKAVITPAMIDDLAHEYMRLRGETGVIVGSVHYDREHVHLHFCVSALQYRTGKSFGLSKQQLKELKLSFQEYHKEHYPELTKSAPEHGRGGAYLTHGQWHAKRREEITQTVQQCFDRATTQNEFLTLLRDADLHHYERNGIPTGITHEGAKFRFSKLLEDRELSSLPTDRNEEERVLTEIRSIRERQRERDDRSRDIVGQRER